MVELMQANAQWQFRSDDERFVTLEELYAYKAGFLPKARATDGRGTISTVGKVSELSGHFDISADDPDGDHNLFLHTKGSLNGKHKPLLLTNHAFNRLALRAKAPTEFLARLSPEVAAIAMNDAIRSAPGEAQFYMKPSEKDVNGSMLAITGPDYPRIYDADIVAGVQRLNAASGGGWKVPFATYQEKNPKLATTLYASDHDIWMFLVNEDRPVTLPGGDILNRGFFISNSEMGIAKLRLMTFYYRRVCDNRIVWGAEGVTQVELVHSGQQVLARWEGDIRRSLKQFTESSTASTERRMIAAQGVTPSQLPEVSFVDDSRPNLFKFLTEQVDLGPRMANGTLEYLKVGGGVIKDEKPSLWNLTQAATAWARDNIAHTDHRVPAERAAATMLDMVRDDSGPVTVYAPAKRG